MALIAVALGACKKEDLKPIEVVDCGCYNYSRYVLPEDGDAWLLLNNRSNATFIFPDTMYVPEQVIGGNFDMARWYKNRCGDSTLVWFNQLMFNYREAEFSVNQGLFTEEQATLYFYPTVCEPTDSLIY